MPLRSDDPKEHEAEEKCLSDVRDHGVHVLRVFGDDTWPEFAYSVGLFHNFRHPEIIILGLPADRAHVLINLVRDEVRAGHRFKAGDSTDKLLVDYEVTFRAVPTPQLVAHFGWAIWFYEDGEFPALQLVYPDRDHRWPWQDGVSPSFRVKQPVLADVDVPAWAS